MSMGQIELICELPSCGKRFTRRLGEYKRSKNLNRRQYCSQSCQITHSNQITPRKGNLSNLIPDNLRDEYTPFRWFFGRARERSRSKGDIGLTDLSPEFLKELWEQQNGICPITGWKILLPNSSAGFIDKNNYKNASLDRINSDLWYLKGNVRYVSLIANYAKSIWSDEEVFEFAKAVCDNQ